MWINVHMNHFRHGVMLEDLSQPVRDLALDILRATLSARGFDQARSIMRVNELLAELTGDYDAFGEWPYFVSIFGRAGSATRRGAGSSTATTSVVNTVVFDGRIVMTPAFMGAEPRRIRTGHLAGMSLFDPEESTGLELIRSLDAPQRERAIIYPSIHPDDISPQPAEPVRRPDAGRRLARQPRRRLPRRRRAGDDRRPAAVLLVAVTGTYVGWQAGRARRGGDGRGRPPTSTRHGSRGTAASTTTRRSTTGCTAR